MNKFVKQIKYFAALLLLLGLGIPSTARAQGVVTITGDLIACVGAVKVYIPDISNPSLSYNWSVTPLGMGTVLTGNHTGASVQWMSPGTASVELEIRNAANVIVYTGALMVTVAAMPAPFITSNVELGCQPLHQDSVRGDQPVPPEFDSAHCQLVCENSTVRYYANGDAGSSFSWVVIGALSYSPTSGPYCDVNWGSAGFGEVHLIETSVASCIRETFFCVEIIEGPHAMFETVPLGLAEPIIICRDGELVVQDMSTASAASPIVSYLWDWGDGHTTPMSPGAAGSPMSHVYDSEGDYVVRLTVVNSCGCASTFTRKVKVIRAEAPKIACPRVVCENERAVYSVDPAFRCTRESWMVEGGTIVPGSATPTQVEIVWDNVNPNTGFGYVMYNSCAPCEMIVVEPVPVVLINANIQGPSVICERKQYVFRLPKWPSTEFNWYVLGPAIIEPTDQRNEIVVTATGSGSITLGVQYNNTVLKCGGSAQMDIAVLPAETISGPTTLCQDVTGNFILGSGSSGNWTLVTATGVFVAAGTGGGFGYNFSLPGNYRLSVTGADFCPPEDHFIRVVPTPPLPDVITGATRACAGIPIRYDAGNPVAGTTFQWSVTGGGSVAAAVGDYSFITFGTLPATVKAVRVTTDGLGCVSDTLYYDVDVAVPPMTISGADTVCHSTITSYSLSYTEAEHYEWELSNPLLGSVINGETTPNPQVQWNMPAPPGEDVWLIAKVTKCGVLVTKLFKVYIIGLPVITTIAVSPNDTVCSDIPVTLVVTTSVPITSGTFIVNWGDGPAISYTYPAPISHPYSTTGTTAPVIYTPTVSLENVNGCLGSVTASAPAITVMPKPAAILSPAGSIGFCGTYDDSLHLTVTTGIGGSNSYTLYPGAISVGPSFAVSGSSASAYYVVVSNSVASCTTTTNVVTFYDNCTPGGPGNPDSGCVAAPVVTLGYSNDCGLLTLTSSMAGGTWSTSSPYISGLATSAGGGGTATALAAGEHLFTYNLTYAPGCSKSYYIHVVVPYLPELRHEISCNQAGGNYRITLHDHSTEYPGGTITNRDYYRVPSTWLGSGMTVSTLQAPGTTEIYYQVISDGVNPPCISYDTITTPAFPTVSVFMDASNVYMPGCVDDVAFQIAHTETGTITSHLWTFGDGSLNASDISPIGRVYDAAGPKFPSLRITDLYGCYAESNVSITVVGDPYLAELAVIGSLACQGDPVTLQYNNLGTGYPGTYTWYQESTPLFTGAATTYNVFQPGGYWVLGTDGNGCRVQSDMKPVDVIQVPPVSIMGNTGACIDQTFTLTTQDYGAGYTYLWSGAAAGAGTSLTQTIATPGAYTYYVTITHTATGCLQISPAFTVTVSPPPAAPTLSFNIIDCDPYQVELTAIGVPGTYNWSNGSTGTLIYTPFGGEYQVTLTDTNGCVVQNSIAVPKSLEEYIWIFPTGCFCRQQEAYVIGPIIPLGWGWMKDGSFDVTGLGYMPPYWLAPGHTYNMYLSNAWCDLTSGDMYYMSDTCSNLPGAGVNKPADYPSDSKNKQESRLEVSPNPADHFAMAHFSVAAGSQARNIELVDMTGRILQQHPLAVETGSIRLSLDGYASGMYHVVLRRDGAVAQTVKLSVTQ